MINEVYAISKIRNKDTGEVHEREIRRQGHKLRVYPLEVGRQMVFEYLEGGYIRTSLVESFDVNVGRDLTVTTKNTIYVFDEV